MAQQFLRQHGLYVGTIDDLICLLSTLGQEHKTDAVLVVPASHGKALGLPTDPLATLLTLAPNSLRQWSLVGRPESFCLSACSPVCKLGNRSSRGTFPRAQRGCRLETVIGVSSMMFQETAA